MRTRFIVNLRSGRAQSALPAIQAYAAAHSAEIALTEHAGHGRDLALRAVAQGVEQIVAVGGDGTLNEVASAIVGTSATLGLVPCGSGDGLGRHLGIHGTPEHALDVLAHGTPRLIDTGTVNDHPFFTAAGIGFEAEIAHRFNRLRRRGFWRYLTTSFRTWWRYQPESYAITSNSGTETVRAFTIAVANAGQYGNDARIAPAAQIDDGQLNLTAIPPLRLANAVPLALRLFNGRIDHSPGVITRVGPRFVIERQRAGLFHTDGEVHEGGTRIEFVVRPASLRILVPSPAASGGVTSAR